MKHRKMKSIGGSTRKGCGGETYAYISTDTTGINWDMVLNQRHSWKQKKVVGRKREPAVSNRDISHEG